MCLADALGSVDANVSLHVCVVDVQVVRFSQTAFSTHRGEKDAAEDLAQTGVNAEDAEFVVLLRREYVSDNLGHENACESGVTEGILPLHLCVAAG